MVSTRDGSGDAETAQPGEHSSPPPTLAQVIASIHESRDEQTEWNSDQFTASIRESRDEETKWNS
jgi:hypothetical protein